MLQYLAGSAAEPQGEGPMILAHVCNNAGAWERAGFSAALARKWPRARIAYRAWYRDLGYRLALGTTQLIEWPDERIFIANMIARPGLKWLPVQPRPIASDALAQCLETVANRAVYFRASVHLPQLAPWERIEPLVRRTVAAAVSTYVYRSTSP